MASPPLPTGTRARVSETVEDRIKEYILLNHLNPGSPLPTELELSEQLGVGRSRIREAVKTLSALDIVEVRHGHGTYVGSLSLTPTVSSLAFRALLSAPEDRHMLAELIDVRQMLEASLAAVLVANEDVEWYAELDRLAESMRTRAERGESFDDDDRAFHLTLMQGTGNGLAMQLTGAFWDVQAIAAASLDDDIPLRETAEAHRAIVDAIGADSESQLTSALDAHYRPIRERMARSAGIVFS